MGEYSANTALERMLRSLIEHEEEFRELDAAAGDGDLGITVRSAAASTSPSTFGSLVSHGLAAAAKAIGDEQEADITSLVMALEAGIATVQRRGRAEPGEKTFLDALIPALEAARTATSIAEALPLMRVAAIANTEQMASAVPKHGRAAWVGERACGIPDAGSVVVVRALESLEGSDGKPWIVDTVSQQ